MEVNAESLDKDIQAKKVERRRLVQTLESIDEDQPAKFKSLQ